MKSPFVLVDFENIQPKGLGELEVPPFQIRVFVGARQAKISLETARALQVFGPDVEYIPIEGSGRNALDFHIAFYLGRLAALDPSASFHVISKDTGFDPLIRHLKTLGIPCQRIESIAEVAGTHKASSPSPTEGLEAVVRNLQKRKSARPRTLKTLRTTIRALFASRIAEEEVEDLIQQLIERGLVRIEKGKVEYTS